MVKIVSKIILTTKEIEEIIDLYKKGWGTRRIAEKMSFSRTVVKRALKENGISMDNTVPRVYNCNESVFNTIDTEEKAYWLGFLYADGCVNRNTVSIRLSRIDRDHLVKFLSFISSDANIVDGIQNSYGTETEYSYIEINNAKMIKSLKRLGCVPNKSLTLEFPTEKQVPKHLVNHFIRGYFDGDGSLSTNGKANGYKVSFEGTDSFLEVLKDVLKVNTKISKRRENSSNSYLRFGGNLQVLEKLNYLYHDATVYLDRKYNIYVKIKEEYTPQLIKQRKQLSSRLR